MFKPIVLLLLVLLALPLYAQSPPDQEAVLKEVIRAETQARLDADLEALLESWVQDDNVQRTFIGLGGNGLIKGWEGIANWYKEIIGDRTEAVPAKITNENYVIRMNGDVAWATFEKKIAVEGEEMVGQSREERTLMKQDGTWKFVSMASMDLGSFDPTYEALESGLNGIGYQFLGLGNVEAAIDVFKLNVKLYPGSWNVYDSLGEAYMKAGNKEMAIQHYEKSLALNPENGNGKDMLAKLKEQR